MDTIIHEQQEGQLCAQHCLNALLQGNYFSADILAEIAHELDSAERAQMSEAGLATEEYQRFISEPSHNMDDTGYFSVQVIQKALEVWNLELVPYHSSDPRAVTAKMEPTASGAFICNYRNHWFTVRKLGHQWFNLNSMLTGPELVSDTYLAILLAQLDTEGYSIFLVSGDFPPCQADDLLRSMPATQVNPRPPRPPAAKSSHPPGASGTASQERGPEEDPELEEALRLSLEETLRQEHEDQLERAIQLSLRDNRVSEPSHPSFESRTAPGSSPSAAEQVSDPPVVPEQTTASISDPAATSMDQEVRRRREKFLERFKK